MDVSDSIDGSACRNDRQGYLYEYAGSETPSEAVVNAVTDVAGRPATPFEDGDPLPPLYEGIDPDALDCLFDGDGDGDGDRNEERPADCTVTFRYCGYKVTVEDELVSVASAS